MPTNEEIIEENPMENPENIANSPSDNSTNIDDTQIGNNNSLVQGDEVAGSETLEEGVDEPASTSPEEIIETDTGDVDLGDTGEDLGDFEFGDTESPAYYNLEEEFSTYSTENIEVYTDLEAFETSTIQVDLYQYTILQRLEFMQYALCIVIALLFLQIFVRYKK